MVVEGMLALLKEVCLLFGYISTGDSFKEPLDAEQERGCLLAIAEGDKGARDKLIEHNLRLVAHIAKKYSGTPLDNEDLISIGTIGLIKAISTYNLNKGTQLATYAARCIENEILMTIRTTRKYKSEVSINDPIGVDREGNEISLIDILSSKTDGVMERVMLQLQVERLMEIICAKLTSRERMVLELRYGLNNGRYATQREIAQLLGISRSYVSRIEKKALFKLRTALSETIH